MSAETRAVAESIMKQCAVGCWQFQSPGALIEWIDKALRGRDERAAKIAEEHYDKATECGGGSECSLNIAATIRGSR